MATSPMTGVVRQVCRTAVLTNTAGMTDGQLLERFLTRREEAAFETVVKRHGPMVLGVCRRLLNNGHDAEDAFQAVFLVLVRKSATLLGRATVGNWLYGVACHTALKARAAQLRRRTKEAQVPAMHARESRTDETSRDWQPLLDQELRRLPDKYRCAVVLCDLQGMTRKDAARRLGVPEGTLSGRLTAARRKLAKRLARLGVTLSAGSLAAILTQNAASASVPVLLVDSTVQSAVLLAAGEAAADLISVPVATLTEGVIKDMFLTKLKMAAALVVVAGLIAVAGGLFGDRALARPTAGRPASIERSEAPPLTDLQPVDERVRVPQEQPKDGATLTGGLESVDVEKHTVTIRTFSRRESASTEKTVAVAKDVKVVRDGKEIKFADLKKGGRAMLRLSADQKEAVGITIVGNTVQAALTKVDAEKGTVSITVETRQGKQIKTFQVAKDAKMSLDGKEVKLADLKEGTVVVLTTTVDDPAIVIQIQTPRRRGSNEDE